MCSSMRRNTKVHVVEIKKEILEAPGHRPEDPLLPELPDRVQTGFSVHHTKIFFQSSFSYRVPRPKGGGGGRKVFKKYK